MQFLEVIKGKLIEQCLGIFTTTISRASQDVNWQISRAWRDFLLPLSIAKSSAMVSDSITSKITFTCLRNG